MATKYFVHEGLQFQTIEVPDRAYSSTGSNTQYSDAVTLESVVAALGTGIVTGADTAAQIVTIRGWWTGGSGLQEFSRESVDLNSPLLSVSTLTRDKDVNTGAGQNLHQTSSQYILPPNISLAISALPGAVGDAANARNQLIVRALEVKHDNIQKHAQPTNAWHAWRQYIAVEEFTQERAKAVTNYLINP